MERQMERKGLLGWVGEGGLTHHKLLNYLRAGAPRWSQAGGTWQALGIAVWAK